MNLLQKRPLAAALFLFFAGFFLFANLTFLLRAVLFGVSLIIGFILLFQKRRRPVLIATALLFALAALLSTLSTDLPDYEIRIRKDTTARYSFRTLEQLDEEKNVWLVGSVKDGDGWLFCRLSVDLPDDLPVSAGDRLAGKGRVSALSSFSRRGLYGRGCRGKLTISGEMEAIGHTPGIRAPFSRLAKAVKTTLASRVGGEEGGLLVAMLLGETEELPTGTELLFRRAGISHALAVSGMHLVFLSAALSFLLRRPGLPRPAVHIFVVLFAFFYAALVGFTPSVLRAALMLLFYEGSWFAKRQPDSFSALALSGAIMLLFAPHLIFSVSFLLSYLATLGILLAAQICRSPAKKRSLPAAVARRAGSFALLTLFAVLFTLPVSCSLFGEISLLSIPVNLLLSLPIQLLLYLAVATLVFPFPFVGAFSGRCCTLFLFLLRRIAALPLSPLTFSSPLLSIAGAIPFLTLLTVAFLGLSKRKRIVLCSVSAAVTLVAFLVFALPVRREGRAVLLSDGTDNDLILLRSGASAACIDLGTPDGVLHMLEEELRADRISDLGVYVFTCYDNGAAERFSAVLSSVYVRRVVLTEPNAAERTEYDALVSLLDRVSVGYATEKEDFDVQGYALHLEKTDPANGATTVPLTLELFSRGDRLLYLGEDVPKPYAGYTLPDNVTILFLGSHGETPYFSFRLNLPETVNTVFTGSDFYKTCSVAGGTSELKLLCRKRFVRDDFLP